MTTRVLFVDDEDLLLRSIARSLRTRDDLALTFETDPRVALALLASETFDIIVSDHTMPHMTGIELLKRAREQTPAILRILMTGNATLEIAVAAINEAAIDKYVEKPWPEGRLTDVLDEMVRKVREQRARTATQPNPSAALRAFGKPSLK